MSAFRLLGIRPHRGCNKKYLKNLTPEQLYPFYNSFLFHNEEGSIIKKPNDGQVESISCHVDFPVGIYDRQTADGHSLEINISAIVGKNGTGKSSLIELFFACVYLYSVHHKILKPNVKSLEQSVDDYELEYAELNDRQKKILVKRDHIIKQLNDNKTKVTIKKFEELKKQVQGLYQQEAQLKKRREYIAAERRSNQRKIKEIGSFEKEVKASIYFENNDAYYCMFLQFDKELDTAVNTITNIPKFQQNDYKPLEVAPDNDELARHFFYTIAVNYSHYALNSLVIGDWINSLFHKNDGYTTPIVINPMRTDGNFNINSEMNFARYRLLTNKLQAFNLADQKNESTYITDNHRISKVVFTLNWSKINALPKHVRFKKKEITGNPREHNLLTTFLADYLSSTEQVLLYTLDFPLKEIIANYILNKIDNIPKRYTWFGQGYQFNSNTPFKENEIFFKSLKEDRSHVTYKLKQAVNFLKYFLKDEPTTRFQLSKGQLENNSNLRFELTLPEILDWMGGPVGRDIMPLLPPSIFNIDFELQNDAGSESYFSGLSSGEQQLIHTVQSVIYHLNNLQSAHVGEGNRPKYRSVNLVYDEIELYFHPDYQRRFVADLLQEFERFYVGGNESIRSINILLLTHSPFILSDIPSENILLLELDAKTKRSVPNIVASQTFAANINDLIADGFFLTGTLMGQFAEKEIRKVIDKVKGNDATEADKELLDKVGDTFLKASLKNFKKRHND